MPALAAAVELSFCGWCVTSVIMLPAPLTPLSRLPPFLSPLLQDGGELVLTRRERPHVLVAEGRPVAIFSAGALGNTHSAFSDQTLTVVQPFALT